MGDILINPTSGAAITRKKKDFGFPHIAKALAGNKH
jgi:hypothetical protein